MTIGEGADTGRRIRLGMVGGGRDAFIGKVHRIAARLDDHFVLVAGALSSDAERAQESGVDLGLAPERTYVDYMEMARSEALRRDGIEAVSIVTSNDSHFAIAKAFLESGVHVICDKPLTTDSADVETLVKLAAAKDRILAVTYNYSGSPLIRQARAMVADGILGNIRVVNVEYVQDWLSSAVENTGQKQAAWRTDPARSGVGDCIGDIGTHAFHKFRSLGGELRRFNHSAVACREDAGERAEGKIDWEIPRADTADHAERLIFDSPPRAENT